MILTLADAALYQAKHQGRGRCVLFEWSKDAYADSQCPNVAWRSPLPPLG